MNLSDWSILPKTSKQRHKRRYQVPVAVVNQAEGQQAPPEMNQAGDREEEPPQEIQQEPLVLPLEIQQEPLEVNEEGDREEEPPEIQQEPPEVNEEGGREQKQPAETHQEPPEVNKEGDREEKQPAETHPEPPEVNKEGDREEKQPEVKREGDHKEEQPAAQQAQSMNKKSKEVFGMWPTLEEASRLKTRRGLPPPRLVAPDVGNEEQVIEAEGAPGAEPEVAQDQADAVGRAPGAEQEVVQEQTKALDQEREGELKGQADQEREKDANRVAQQEEPANIIEDSTAVSPTPDTWPKFSEALKQQMSRGRRPICFGSFNPDTDYTSQRARLSEQMEQEPWRGDPLLRPGTLDSVIKGQVDELVGAARAEQVFNQERDGEVRRQADRVKEHERVDGADQSADHGTQSSSAAVLGSDVHVSPEEPSPSSTKPGFVCKCGEFLYETHLCPYDQVVEGHTITKYGPIRRPKKGETYLFKRP